MTDTTPHQTTKPLVTSLNLNGLRAARRKGLDDWVRRVQPEVLLLQEVRAPEMPEVFEALGYHSVWHPAQKAGYSGVAIASRAQPESVSVGIGDEATDAEGRVLGAVVGGVRYVSVYLPSGTSGPVRQAFKDRLLGLFQTWVEERLAEGGPLVIGGDYNIAHTELDIKNWRGNRKNSGFLPHEREWMTRHLGGGLTDTHRAHLQATAGPEAREYTWWSQRGQAYANDTGWRIDYLLTAGVRGGRVWVDRPARLSDHAPLSLWRAEE